MDNIDSHEYSCEGADVLIVTLRTGFPHGMAASRRILLIARALREGGLKPAVIHMNTSETSSAIRNTDVEGCFQSIPFRYACGTVTRSRSFLLRRFYTLKGFILTCLLIVRGGISRRLKSVIFYERSIFSLLPIMFLCKILKIVFTIDVVEWPVAMELDQDLIGRISLRLYRTIAIRSADRVTVISRFLLKKARKIRNTPGTVMYLPILGDPVMFPVHRQPVRGRFVISISSGYSRELALILEAFAKVRIRHPEAELHVTGGLGVDDLHRLLNLDRPVMGGVAGVKCRGYLSRSDLMELFSTSCAAVVALEDDLRSLSRMPTKIADYTFNSTPLVIGDIGDISRTFSDGVNAFMYAPGDSTALAEALFRTLETREETERIGARGRDRALELFSFDNYSGELVDLLAGKGVLS